MSFERDFLTMMPHSVTFSTVASISGYGKPTYSASATTVSGLVQYQQKLVRSFDGDEVLSVGSVILATTKVIKPTDKLTLPDATTPPILAVERLADDEGGHHVEVYFG